MLATACGLQRHLDSSISGSTWEWRQGFSTLMAVKSHTPGRQVNQESSDTQCIVKMESVVRDHKRFEKHGSRRIHRRHGYRQSYLDFLYSLRLVCGQVVHLLAHSLFLYLERGFVLVFDAGQPQSNRLKAEEVSHRQSTVSEGINFSGTAQRFKYRV